MRRIAAVSLWLFALAAPAGAYGAAATPIVMHVEGADIRLTTRYEEARTRVMLRVCEGCDAVVRLSSPAVEARFPLKGKTGPFWLTVGRVSFHDVPWLYLVKSTGSLDRILSPAESRRYALDEAGLEASIRVQSGVDRRLYLNELVKLKKAEGTFGFDAGGLRKRGDGGLEAVFRWPAGTPPGRYTIDAFAVSGGRVVGRVSRDVLVHEAGLAAWISRLAVNHGVVYGVLAVLVAMLTGLIARLVFRRMPLGSGRS
jgi:uncharacterized protein (TIGR02186 family)